jgi:hypothetical protein
VTLDGIVHWFETLTRDSAADVGRYYADEAYFRDPFNEVAGADRIGRVFAHLFDQVEAPRFRVLDRWESGAGAMLVWDFTFRLRGRAESIRGATHLRLAPDGRISHHRDYWDAAELYGKLPAVGALMRFLRKRVRA